MTTLLLLALVLFSLVGAFVAYYLHRICHTLVEMLCHLDLMAGELVIMNGPLDEEETTEVSEHAN